MLKLAISWIVGLAGWLGASLLLASCGDHPSPPPTRESADTGSTNLVAEQTPVRPEFVKLKGKWLRPDGGYVLDIRDVDASGTLEAGYFNPSPINVSKALAIQQSGKIKVFVELRDVHYPGCTYSLTYDVGTDQLYGEYYQAGTQQTYDVAFERLKE